MTNTNLKIEQKLLNEVKKRAIDEGKFAYEWISEAIIEKLEKEGDE